MGGLGHGLTVPIRHGPGVTLRPCWGTVVPMQGQDDRPGTAVPGEPAVSGGQWIIRAAGHEAAIVEVGGGVREYLVRGVPVLDGYGPDELCPAGAGQVLAPWPNRIRDGRYRFAGEGHQLPLTEPEKGTAIHGLTRWSSWQLTDRAGHAVTVQFRLRPQPGYPFDLLLTTRWSVSTGGLRADHTAVGVGSQPAPFGLGVHPYLIVPGVPPDDLRLTVPAERVLRVDPRGLPDGIDPVAGDGTDFRSQRRIGSARLDTAFTGLRRDHDGQAVVRLAGGDGHAVELWMGPAFGWVQVFTADTLPAPRTRRSVAVEPMTCPPDAFNSGEGLLTLASGQEWRGSWGLRSPGSG